MASSKRIVLTTWGSQGDLDPYIALGRELADRGHRPLVASLPFHRDRVTAAGLAFHPLRPTVADDPDVIREQVRRILDPHRGPPYMWKTLIMPSIRDMYEDTVAAIETHGGADGLVSHFITVTTPLVAEKLALPWVSVLLAPMTLFSIHDPPAMPQFPWLRRLLALHPSLARSFLALGRRSTRSWVVPLAALRSELGLPPTEAHPLFEGKHSPLATIGLYSPLFGPPQPDFPPQLTITGFPYGKNSPGEPLPGLLEFLDAGEPPLLFTLGSSAIWIAEDFYAVSIEAARRLGRRALLLTGPSADLPDPLPDGVAAFDYAPHGLVMPRASLIVHQGGIGTTAQALRSGRPMLIVPHGPDQPDNARRCVGLGVARILKRRSYRVDRLVRQLERLLRDPAYEQRAAEIGRRLADEDGVGRAVDVIEAAFDR